MLNVEIEESLANECLPGPGTLLKILYAQYMTLAPEKYGICTLYGNIFSANYVCIVVFLWCPLHYRERKPCAKFRLSLVYWYFSFLRNFYTHVCNYSLRFWFQKKVGVICLKCYIHNKMKEYLHNVICWHKYM